MEPIEAALTVVGMILALSGFTFVYFGDHWGYGIAENIYLGGGLAYSLFAIHKSLTASCFDQIAAGRVSLIIPLIIGIGVFARLTRIRWFARYAISTLSGIGVGLTFGLYIKAQIIVVLSEIVRGLVTLTPDPISAVLATFGTVTVFMYFLYSKRFGGLFHERRMRYLGRLGKIFLFSSLGYLFGKIYVNESLDSVADFFVAYIYNSLQALKVHFGIV